VVEAGRVRMQTVELGQRNNEEGQILSGAQAGQTIVLHPPDTLSDGTRISERRE
jgi:HlyD family secretion protein